MSSTSQQIAEQIFKKLSNLEKSAKPVALIQKNKDGSFLKKANRARLSKTQMQESAAGDPIAGLNTLWKETDPQFLLLIPDLKDLARKRKEDLETMRQNNDNLSEFIYQMW